MDLALNGKVALITGASRGIGKSCALALAEEKCHIAICSRDKETLDKAAEELKTKGADVLAVQADVTKQADTPNSFPKRLKSSVASTFSSTTPARVDSAI